MPSNLKKPKPVPKGKIKSALAAEATTTKNLKKRLRKNQSTDNSQ